MKKEIISFVIGAGVVGCVWFGTTFSKRKTETSGVPAAADRKNAVEQLNLQKTDI